MPAAARQLATNLKDAICQPAVPGSIGSVEVAHVASKGSNERSRLVWILETEIRVRKQRIHPLKAVWRVHPSL